MAPHPVLFHTGWVRDARGTFWLLCGSTLGVYVAQGLLYPGLPLYLTRELGTSKAVAGLIMTSTSLSAIAARPWAGAFIDRRGRRPLLLAGPLVVVITALGLLAVANVWWVLAMRLIQGVGSAMGYSASAAMAADLAPPEQRARYLARFGMFFYIGFAIGPWLAELLIGQSGFDVVWLTVAGCALVGVIVAWFLPETGVARGAAAGPPMPLRRRFMHPAAVGPGLVFFCLGVGWTALSAFLALYARDVGMGSSGPLFLALSVTVLCTRAFAGSLADRLGKAAVLYPSVVAVVGGMTILAVFRQPGPAYVGVVLFGGGFSGLFPVLFAMVVDRAPDTERGAAMSSFNLFFDVGSPLGGYGVGQLIDWGGFGLGFGSMAALGLVGALAMPQMLRSDAASRLAALPLGKAS